MSSKITVYYTPPTTNVDGSALKPITKYTIGWDTAAHPNGDYPNLVIDADFSLVTSGPQAGQQFTVITVPGPGTYFLNVDDTTSDGTATGTATSNWAGEIQWTVPVAQPNPPSKLSASS